MNFRPRKRFGNRQSHNQTSDQYRMGADAPTMINNNANAINTISNNLYSNNSETPKHHNQTKRDSKIIIHDEETTTDWTPEIPFRNVRNISLSTFITILLISF